MRPGRPVVMKHFFPILMRSVAVRSAAEAAS